MDLESCWSPGWPAHKASGSWPCPHSTQQRKSPGHGRAVRPARRQNKLRLQDPSRPRRASGSLQNRPWLPGSKPALSPHHWPQGSGCTRHVTPTRLLLSNTEVVPAQPFPALISWPDLSHHHDYLPRPPSLGTSNRSSRSQHAFSTDLPLTTPGVQ